MAQTWFINGRHMNMNEVRAWRAAQKSNQEAPQTPEKEPTESLDKKVEPSEVQGEQTVEVVSEVLSAELTLEELQKAYAEKFPDKKLVGKYSKDAKWIKSKLNS